MDNFQRLRCELVFFAVFILALSTHTFAEEDVIGQYAVSNEEQCRRLCWYRGSCETYSYYIGSAATNGNTPTSQNCILLSTQGIPHDGWIERLASSSHIQNGCKNRPCSDTDVCVPASSTSASHACLPMMRTQCIAKTQDIPHGDVIVSSRYDYLAHVACHTGYIASPKGVSLEIKCSEASGWTPFAGTCKQYEVNHGGSAENLNISLPWELSENSELCIIGVVTENEDRLPIDLAAFDQNIFVRLVLRFDPPDPQVIYFRLKENDDWVTTIKVANNTVHRGESFNITVRLLRNEIQYVLNEADPILIPLDTIVLTDGSLYDVKKTKIFSFIRAKHVNYVNMIKGC